MIKTSDNVFCVSGSPKTATTSVCHVFSEIFKENGYTVEEFNGPFRHAVADCKYLIVCVRHPFEHVKSAYRYFKQFNNPKLKPIVPVALEGWSKFATTWDGNYSGCSSNDFVAMGDYFVRQEAIEEDVNKICQIFNLYVPEDLEFPHLLKTKNKERLVLTKDKKEAINKNFDRVIKLYSEFETGNPQGRLGARDERKKRK